MEINVKILQKISCQMAQTTITSPSLTSRQTKKFSTKYINKLNSSRSPMRKQKTRLDEMEIRNKNGMLDKSCPIKKTNPPECWFDSSHTYICMTEKKNQTLVLCKFCHQNTRVLFSLSVQCMRERAYIYVRMTYVLHVCVYITQREREGAGREKHVAN